MTRDDLIHLLLNLLNRHAPPLDVEYMAARTMSEWNALLAMAKAQKILPLLFHRMERLGLQSAVPHEIWFEIRKLYLGNITRNLRLYGELGRIVPFLRAEQIPVIALKGLHLAQAVYRNIALRRIGDMDILVPLALVPRAWELLVAHGYQNPPGHTVDFDMQTKHQYHVLLRLIKPRPAAVEMHWSLTRPNERESLSIGDIQGIWDRSTPIDLGGIKMSGLSPEDLLLHLCLHTSYHHRFEFGLQPSCDIAWTIDHFGAALDWELLGKQARNRGWERGVTLALRLACDLMGARVPEVVWATLKNGESAGPMVALAREQVFASQNTVHVSEYFAHFLEEKSLRGRVGQVFDRIFLPSGTVATAHFTGSNSLRLYWHYLAHLRDMLCRCVRVGWRLLRGDVAVTKEIKRKDQLSRWLAGTPRTSG